VQPSEGCSDAEVLNRYQQVAPQLPHSSFVQAAEAAFGPHIAQVRLVRFWIIGEKRQIARNRTAELVRGCYRMLALGTPVWLLSISRRSDFRDMLLLA
jgi:hypothetical protein